MGSDRRHGRTLPGGPAWLVAGLVLAGVVVAVAGCSQRGPHPAVSPAPTLTLVAPPLAATADPAWVGDHEAALAAYRGMWRAYDDAIKIPDPGSAELARYTTGRALDTLVNGLRSVKDRGLKGVGDAKLSPVITSMTRSGDHLTEVEVTDCTDTSKTHLIRASAGPPYADTPGGRRLCLATVKRQPDGSWKVISFGVQAVGSCG